jgi:hypothetical protein
MKNAAPAAKSPVVADIFAGRFFVGGEAFKLIAAPKDEGKLAATKWGNLKAVPGAISYCNGLGNTEAMAKAGSELGKWARGLRISGFDDWYIPSRLEALLLFSEVKVIGGFESDWYWTSTQCADTAQCAWCQYFGYGFQSYCRKDSALRARAVRRVKI